MKWNGSRGGRGASLQQERARVAPIIGTLVPFGPDGPFALNLIGVSQLLQYIFYMPSPFVSFRSILSSVFDSILIFCCIGYLLWVRAHQSYALQLHGDQMYFDLMQLWRSYHRCRVIEWPSLYIPNYLSGGKVRPISRQVFLSTWTYSDPRTVRQNGTH